MQPSLIILDEPTAGLDPLGVSEILHLLEDIKENMGISVIISTHDIDLVPLYCDDVFVLDKGTVIFSGTPEELFGKPELLREHNLRLPRITHLMNILYDKDNLDVDRAASTISQARKSIKNLVGTDNQRIVTEEII
jgi:cobalt/nickel transport system ATP-binding protein